MTMIKIVLTYHVFFSCIFLNLHAQSFIEEHSPKRLTQYVLDHWQVKEGLPQNSVNAMVQTNDGYLWMGTYEGLVRFNGTSFTVFDKGNTPEFASNRITSLCKDPKGRLWIGSYGGGITMYDGESFSTPVRDSLTGLYVSISSMTADSSGRIWAITEKGVYQIRETVLEQHYPLSLFGSQVPIRITTDAKGRIWLWTYTKLFVIDSGAVNECMPDHPQHLVSPSVPSRDGTVWVFDYAPDGTGIVTKYGRQFTAVDSIPRSLITQGVSPLFEDSRGTLWCYMREGIATYANGAWDQLRKETGFVSENVQSIIEDREGSIWIGTNGSGLLRFRDSRFTPLGIPEGLPNENVWSIFEDSRGTKFIGTLGGGYYRIDRQGIHVPSRKFTTEHFCFLEDRNNNIWLSGNELLRRNGTSRPLPREFLSFTLAMDSIGRIWLASQNGGIRIIENEKIIDSLYLGNPPADISIRTMKTDFDSSMWIGTQEGLFHYRKQTLTRYTVKDGLPNNWIRSIYQDANGTLWIATDGGLAKRKNNRFYSYTVNNGLYSNTIHVILEDDRGTLWMSSNKGVFVVKKSDIELFDDHTIDRIPCTIYGEEDGMRSAEGNGSFQQGGWKMRDGTLWFATIKGIAIVDPNNLKNNTVIPPVHIEKIVSDGKEISERSAFTLHYPVSDITFYFNALSFRVPSRIRYKYILEGFHTDWIDAGNQHRATFTNLPSGDFVFRVIACNDDGVWNTTGASVSFSLPPPFWATWWFSVIVGVIIFGSFAGLIRYIELKKVRRRIEQLEHEKALERERARISKDMHDEVGANLTKIAILSELAARNADDTPKHLRKITETSREVIDSMGQIIWAINPKNDKLENMAAYLREFISETFEMTAIRASISFADELPIQSLSAEFRRNIFLTVKEAVNNIVKYSKATEIHAQLHVETGRLLFSISDNGIGFDVSHASRFGNGLYNMKKRIEDIGGSFVIESAAGKGTIISISVQL